MELGELVVLFVWSFFWFFMGFLYREHLAMKKIQTMISHMEEVVNTVVRIRIEQVNGMLYIYNMETNEFMAQGKTRQQLEQNLKDRFPDTKFAATAENLKEVFANDPF
jgi:hypothetical protein